MLEIETTLSFCKETNKNTYILGMSDKDIIELSDILYPIALRIKFYNEEGYMASDEYIKEYYKEK